MDRFGSIGLEWLIADRIGATWFGSAVEATNGIDGTGMDSKGEERNGSRGEEPMGSDRIGVGRPGEDWTGAAGTA